MASSAAAAASGSSFGLVSLCGVLAPAASVLVCMSPASTIMLIAQNRHVGSFPLLPYSTMVINAALWLAYGLLKNLAPIWSCNAIGLVLGLSYVYFYIQFSPAASPTLPGTVRQHLMAMGGILSWTVLISVLPIVSDPSWIIGKVGVAIGILLFASPLSVLRHVLATKSARSIPLPFTIASTTNCFLWTVYGIWQVNDANVYFPNFVGLLFSLAQLGLKIHYDENILQEFSMGSGAKPDGTLPLTAS
jgi:solute carrier family 50 (sugar transporter)